MSEPVARLPILALAGEPAFRCDARFALSDMREDACVEPAPEEDVDAALARAWAEGRAAGAAEARAQADADRKRDQAAQATLELALTRLDAALQEELRLRLRETVAALCEASLAPLALEPAALERRIERAVSMLARVDDERIVRLHPDDIALLSPRSASAWHIEPEASLERGSVRVENNLGGIEDGPETWRRTIAEALLTC